MSFNPFTQQNQDQKKTSPFGSINQSSQIFGAPSQPENIFNQQNQPLQDNQNPFSPFGTAQQQGVNVFGQQGSAQTGNIFGQQQQSPFGSQQPGTVFGQQQQQSPFQQQTTQSTPFGMPTQQTCTTPGFQGSTLQPSSNVFGSTSVTTPQPTAANPFSNVQGFGSQPSTQSAFSSTAQQPQTFQSTFPQMTSGATQPADSGFGAMQTPSPFQQFGSTTQQSPAPAASPFQTQAPSASPFGQPIVSQQSVASSTTSPSFGATPGTSPFQQTVVPQTAENIYQVKADESSHKIEEVKPVFKFETEKLPEQTIINDTTLNTAADSTQKTSFLGHSSSIGSKERLSSFTQMTVYEIIQEQVKRLEENVQDFNNKAKEIFIQDEKIMRALNNYKILKDVLEKEEKKMSELEDSIDFFEKLLEDFSKKIPVSEDDELITCIKEFERVSDNFYKSVESIKDEEDEIFSLVKENHNLASVIDEKLDMLDRFI